MTTPTSPVVSQDGLFLKAVTALPATHSVELFCSVGRGFRCGLVRVLLLSRAVSPCFHPTVTLPSSTSLCFSTAAFSVSSTSLLPMFCADSWPFACTSWFVLLRTSVNISTAHVLQCRFLMSCYFTKQVLAQHWKEKHGVRLGWLMMVGKHASTCGHGEDCISSLCGSGARVLFATFDPFAPFRRA